MALVRTFIVLAAICIIAATVRSSALAAGPHLSATVSAAAPRVAVLLDKPYTLEQVANTFHWSVSTLASADGAVRVEVLPGAWIAAAAAAGFLLMAAARCAQASAEDRRR